MYTIEKHYRLTDEVRKFKAMTKAEAERIFFSFTHSAKTDMYNYPIEQCFSLGHASFTNFDIVVIRED